MDVSGKSIDGSFCGWHKNSGQRANKDQSPGFLSGGFTRPIDFSPQ
jgi:hypothetical protein